ncbi:cytochrome P450 [Dunaliella salina]|uniref:Cytochrome P450 n=1 Tax=Dunaliella salina TaxID=3046 RepID=A0ABQ7GAB6_DUNSA|nr:cytochrome P450 [Dunaliella salina]|eukprot:KAF5831541.1 cytochrome P450 [Dunaliella salina]
MDTPHNRNVALLCVGGVAVASSVYVYVRSRRSPKPPGPPCHSNPIKNFLLKASGFGHAPVLAAPQSHIILKEWANTYGPIFSLQLGMPAVVISDAQMQTSLLKGELATSLPKLKALEGIDPFVSMGHPNLVTISDERSPMWRSFRKTIAQSFSSQAMQAAFPAVRSCVEEMVQMWRAEQKEGRPIDVRTWMYKLLLEMLGRASFGLEFNALQDGQHEYLALMHENMHQMQEVTGKPLASLVAKLFPFLPHARRSAERLARCNSMYEKIYDDLKARGPPSEKDQSLAANLMRVVDHTTGEPFPEMTVKGNLAVITIAGFDTTATTLVWALYDIARHRHMQQRIKEELAAAGLLQVEGAPLARALEWSDWNAFPYLNMVLKESLRVHPVVPQGTIREARQDLMVGGYHVKKGTIVWMPFYPNFNSRINFSNPGANRKRPNTPVQYRVGQYATPNGHALAANSLIPFSLGSRSCVGQPLANVEARIALLIILSNFWCELAPPTPSHEEVEASQVIELVLTSGVPIMLQLKPHKSAK